MKLMLAAVTAAALGAMALPALAQEGPPPYDLGPVWTTTAISTKDGRTDEYVRWLATGWKTQEEALKRAGVILDYKVFFVDSPRAGEPDIILAQEWRNMAAFDASPAQIYAMQSKLGGPPPAQANKEEADRGALRTVMGSTTMREIELK
ncbi:MAG TPA: hypothetical protein VGS12_13090 [Caulobacteraceae bacterium]|nr:hypothetical protein [Caulobacteraceae bacterium]